MITEIENVKVGCFVLCTRKENNDSSIYEITKIEKLGRYECKVYNADENDPNSFILINDLFVNPQLNDYVFENEKEMFEKYPEYFV
jgi:hypothetical protein